MYFRINIIFLIKYIELFIKIYLIYYNQIDYLSSNYVYIFVLLSLQSYYMNFELDLFYDTGLA